VTIGWDRSEKQNALRGCNTQKFDGKLITPGSDPNITGYGTGPADNAGAGVGATAPPMFQPRN